MRKLWVPFTLVLALLAAACATSALPLPNPQSPAQERGQGHAQRARGHFSNISLIQHVVVVVMENRTVDNLFNGFPGADTAQYGRDHLGNIVPLQPAPLYEASDVSHSHEQFLTQYDGGKMDGFDKSIVRRGGPTPAPANYPYQFTQQSDVLPYWTIAQQYVLGDRMFQSNSGPSLPAHQYLIAGQSGASDNPINDPGATWGCDARPGATAPFIDQKTGLNVFPGKFPCYDYQTLGDELDKARLSWRYYAPGGIKIKVVSAWLAYDAIRHIRYGSDWTNGDIAATENFQTDVARGTLPAVTWIVPPGVDSDHAGSYYGTDTGPQWLASIVNAIGQSQYWNSTAILITWDDWGGWYDHVAPPQLDHNGLGFRVPLLVVSPYAKTSYISHVQHEFGSILKFTEESFRLKTLSTADQRADDLLDCFDFTQTPRLFTPINPNGAYVHGLGSDPPDTD